MSSGCEHSSRQPSRASDQNPDVSLDDRPSGGGSPGGDIELRRDHLVNMFYDVAQDDVEYLFEDTITTLTQDDDGVDVTFARGGARRFDLVVGADSLHSAVRRRADAALARSAHDPLTDTSSIRGTIGLFAKVSNFALIGGYMKRGEIWWADIDLAFDDELWDNKRRPVVLLSREDASELRAMLIVAPAKTDIRGIAIEVRVGAEEGLSHEGVLRVAIPRPGRILCDWLLTLAQPDLIERAGTLSSAKLRQLEDALRLAELDASRWGG